MNSLQPRQRELFEKVYIQRRSYTSIAAEEGVTEAAIRNRLKKIHEKLKKSSAEGGSNGSIFSLIAKGQENVPRKGDEKWV
jgi:DNA-directed RNA polymerase specialized sigma24 family protein